MNFSFFFSTLFSNFAIIFSLLFHIQRLIDHHHHHHHSFNRQNNYNFSFNVIIIINIFVVIIIIIIITANNREKKPQRKIFHNSRWKRLWNVLEHLAPWHLSMCVSAMGHNRVFVLTSYRPIIMMTMEKKLFIDHLTNKQKVFNNSQKIHRSIDNDFRYFFSIFFTDSNQMNFFFGQIYINLRNEYDNIVVEKNNCLFQECKKKNLFIIQSIQ